MLEKKHKFLTGDKILDEAVMLLIFKRREYRSEEDFKKLIRATEDMDFFKKLNQKKINVENELHMQLAKAMDH